MTHISELVTAARSGAARYRGCSQEQALVYSCEDIAHLHQPTRVLTKPQVTALVADICTDEDVDIPLVEFGRRRARCTASFEPVTRTVTFHGPAPFLADVIHETAHVVSGTGNHDAEFRSALVRMSRRWAGVEHASLLHHLLAGVGLQMDPWSVR